MEKPVCGADLSTESGKYRVLFLGFLENPGENFYSLKYSISVNGSL